MMSLIEWSGDEAPGLELLAGLRDELQPLASDLSVVPFLTIQTITDEIFAHGLRTYIKAGFADDLSDGLIDAPCSSAPSRSSRRSRRSSCWPWAARSPAWRRTPPRSRTATRAG